MSEFLTPTFHHSIPLDSTLLCWPLPSYASAVQHEAATYRSWKYLFSRVYSNLSTSHAFTCAWSAGLGLRASSKGNVIDEHIGQYQAWPNSKISQSMFSKNTAIHADRYDKLVTWVSMSQPLVFLRIERHIYVYIVAKCIGYPCMASKVRRLPNRYTCKASWCVYYVIWICVFRPLEDKEGYQDDPDIQEINRKKGWGPTGLGECGGPV